MRSVGTRTGELVALQFLPVCQNYFDFSYSLLRRTQAAQFHKTKFPQNTVTICATFMQYVYKDLYSIFRLYIFFLIALAVLVFFIYSCDFTIILILICIIIIRRNLHRRLRNTRPCKYGVLLRIERAFSAML